MPFARVFDLALARVYVNPPDLRERLLNPSDNLLFQISENPHCIGDILPALVGEDRRQAVERLLLAGRALILAHRHGDDPLTQQLTLGISEFKD